MIQAAYAWRISTATGGTVPRWAVEATSITSATQTARFINHGSITTPLLGFITRMSGTCFLRFQRATTRVIRAGAEEPKFPMMHHLQAAPRGAGALIHWAHQSQR